FTVQGNGTRFELHRLTMDLAGSRKYSTPHWAATSGEEAARRAMPIFPWAGSGGGGTGRASRSGGTGGNREGLAIFARAGPLGPEFARTVEEVAIACLV